MTENEILIKTPEEAIETIKSNMPTSGYQMLRESLDMAISALKEIQRYRKIGTVEECREAVEKQKPKKPRILSSRGEKGGKYCVCPRCNGVTGKYISYCRSCGQAIQWNENLEGMEDE